MPRGAFCNIWGTWMRVPTPVLDGELIRAEIRRAAESSCRAKVTLLRVFAISASRCSGAALGLSPTALSRSGARMTRRLSHAETDSMPALISRSSRLVRISAADRTGIRVSSRGLDEIQSGNGDSARTQIHDESRFQQECILALVGALVGQ